MQSFKARIEIIGVNPFVLLPDTVLEALFVQSGNRKGKIPVTLYIDGHSFPQTLVRYAGAWRLYLNGPMRKAAGKDVGDEAMFMVHYDPADRTIEMPVKLKEAFRVHKEAKQRFDLLPPSRQHEIIRYIAHLKTEQSVDRNIARAIGFLMGKERFVGREKT